MATDAPIAWTFGFAGAYLIYAAIVNKSPVDQLKAVLTADPSKAGPIAVTSRAASIAGVSTIPGANETSSGVGSFAPVTTASPADQQAAQAIAGGAPLRLVAIGNGQSLAAPAAAAYKLASAAYGRPIPITGAYRSLAVQASAYAKDPERFAPPNRSLHPKGLAIDVNSANQADPALISALQRAGWAQTALPKEPWHWSFGVRG